MTQEWPTAIAARLRVTGAARVLASAAARRREPEPSRKPFHGPRAAAGRASSTTRNDREPCPGSPTAETREATANPNSAKRCRARCRCPRNSRSCASGNNAPAAAKEPPSEVRSMACTSPPRSRQSQTRSATHAAGRKTRVQANAASPPMSPRGHPEPRSVVSMPSHDARLNLYLLIHESPPTNVLVLLASQSADITKMRPELRGGSLGTADTPHAVAACSSVETTKAPTPQFDSIAELHG